MTPDLLHTAFYNAVMESSRTKERSLQAAEFVVGVSDLGYCSERTRRMLAQQVPDDTDELAAFLGIAIGDHVEAALVKKYPHLIRQAEVEVELHGDAGRTYTVKGHPDLIDPDDHVVIDVKTAFGLGLARRKGPDQQKQFQRHCYALGAFKKGLLGECSLDEVQVANVWFDRSGQEKDCVVQIEPFDMAVVDAAAAWLDDVVYAYLNETEARKEPPREVCEATCGFYRDCRLLDTDVEGLITDPEKVAAATMYREGITLERQGGLLKAEAKEVLQGTEGSTGNLLVRWVHVNGGPVSFTRSSYERLDVKVLK